MATKRTRLNLPGSDVLVMAMYFLLVPEVPVADLAAGCLDYDRFGRSDVEERLTGRLIRPTAVQFPVAFLP